MYSSSRITIALAAMAIANAIAATTTRVDIPTRDATQRFLYVHPDKPTANIVFLPGLNGVLGIEDDGSMATLAARCGPISRNRDAFAARGFALALVDRTSDGKVRQFEDVREVVSFMRKRDDVPTWIVGGSGSTLGTLNFAAKLPTEEPLGLIIFSPFIKFFSPFDPDLALAALVRRTTLIVYHQEDANPASVVGALFDTLTWAPLKERIVLTGGTKNDECGGYHLFRGIDADFVATVADFIEKHKAFTPP